MPPKSNKRAKIVKKPRIWLGTDTLYRETCQDETCLHLVSLHSWSSSPKLSKTSRKFVGASHSYSMTCMYQAAKVHYFLFSLQHSNWLRIIFTQMWYADGWQKLILKIENPSAFTLYFVCVSVSEMSLWYPNYLYSVGNEITKIFL